MHNNLKIQLANYAGAYRSMATTQKRQKPELGTPTENERKVFSEAEKAWERYSQSATGKKEIAALGTMDLPAIRQYVSGILDHPEFKELRHLLDTLELPASSFSIGLCLEAEFIVGFSATLGIAIGIGDSKGVQSAEFLTISLLEGAEAGALAGVEFGLWKCIPSDLGGYSWGTQVAIGFEVEGSVAVFYTLSGISGFTLTVGGGVDEGGSEIECYTFILGEQGADPYIKPVIQPRKNNFLIIESLKCVHPSNDGGGDENEAYFTFQADGDTVYPYPTYDYFSLKEGNTWACGRSVWFNNSVAVTVYDEDGTSNDDILGTFSIQASELSLGQTKTFHSTKNYSSGMDKVEYTINVKLVAQNVAH